MLYFFNIAYYLIFGRPLIMYLGIITLSSFLITALLGFAINRGIVRINLKWHFRMAYVSLAIAAIHGSLGILSYL